MPDPTHSCLTPHTNILSSYQTVVIGYPTHCHPEASRKICAKPYPRRTSKIPSPSSCSPHVGARHFGGGPYSTFSALLTSHKSILMPDPIHVRHISEASGRFKKACPEPLRLCSGQAWRRKGRQWLGVSRRGQTIALLILKGETIVCARSVLPVREHGKLVRTPLTVFFNSPLLGEGGSIQ